MYVDQLWVRDGEYTVVKIFVAHNIPPVSFNTIKYATVCNDLDGVVTVSSIQASSTSEAGYLLSSRKTQNDIHWDHSMNTNPKLKSIDVNIVTIKKIDANLSAP